MGQNGKESPQIVVDENQRLRDAFSPFTTAVLQSLLQQLFSDQDIGTSNRATFLDSRADKLSAQQIYTIARQIYLITGGNRNPQLLEITIQKELLIRSDERVERAHSTSEFPA